MTLKLIITAIVLINGFSIVGMDTIKMPRADALQKRLHRFGFDALVPCKLMNASEEGAADVMLTPQRLVVAIEWLIRGHSDQKGNLPGMLAKIPAGKVHSLLMEAFVGDDVPALEQLKSQALYTPSSVPIVKMPNANILRERLETTYLPLFIRNSAIVENLADSDWTPLGVAAELDDSIKLFSEFLRKSGRPTHLASSLENEVRASKQKLLAIFLQDTPGALDELRALTLGQ